MVGQGSSFFVVPCPTFAIFLKFQNNKKQLPHKACMPDTSAAS